MTNDSGKLVLIGQHGQTEKQDERAGEDEEQLSRTWRGRTSVDGWTEFRFRLTGESDFDHQRHVRLRGISAFVVGGGESTWEIVARVPGSAQCHHLGTDAAVTLDQRVVPPIRLGRVGRRRDPQQGDVAGYDLRHSCATLLLAHDVSPRVVMETLGHSQVSLTLDTYSHVLPALQEDAASKMDAILSKA